MPIVRRYGQQRVGVDQLPGPRATAAKTLLSEGAGLQQAKADTAGVIGGLAQHFAGMAQGAYAEIVAKERQRANETAVLDASNELDRYENGLLYGDGTEQNTGALKVRGKNALGLPEQVNDAWTKRVGEIEATLSTPDQRGAFARVKAQHGQNLDATIRRHTAEQIDVYEAGVTKSKVDLAVNNAIANAFDDRRIAEELGSAEEALRIRAKNTGTPAEQLDVQLAAVRTATHAGVVERLLALDHPADAKAYFDHNKDEISGEQLAALETKLEEGGQRKESQTRADAIIAAGGTLQDRLDKAKTIDDPKLRDMVEERIEHQDNIDLRAKRDASEARDKTMYDVIEKGTTLTQLQLRPEWQEMNTSQREDATRHLERKIAGTPTPNGQPAYYDLMGQAASLDPAEREKFLTYNLQGVRGKLSQSDWDRVWSIQQSMRAGDTKKSAQDLSGFRTNQAIATDTLELLGMDPNAKSTGTNANPVQAKKNAQFMRLLDQEVEAWQTLNGKKASNSDVQEMADKIVRDQTRATMIDRPWYSLYNDSVAPVFLGVTVGDIPPALRAEIEAALNDRRERPTDARILDLYYKKLAKDAKK